MRTDDDLGLTRLLDRAAGSDSLTQARELAELEQRLFSRTIEPVRLNRYVLLERLGSGGFGVVYLGYDPELDRRVAIKLLHGRKADDRSLDKAAPGGELLVEAQAMAKFSHPNVVAIHDVGSFDASERSHLHTLGPRGSADATGTFIVMELVDGVTLRQWLTEPRLPLEIIEVFVQAGQGLAAAHRAGLIHGDFKPDNVIVGHDRRVRVLDFGLAQARAVPGASAPQGAVITGTPAYMAPEQLDGASADASVDQYAFALALREALYGIDPRQRDSPLLGSPRKVESMRTKLLPRHARGIFTRALQVEPALRYPDMQALLDALTGQRRRRVERWVAAAGGLAIVIGLSSWVASPQRPDCSPDEQLEGIWDPATQQQLELQFGRSGAVDGAEIWKSVRSTLDDHAAQWSEAWSSTCEATADRSQPSAAVAGQLSCLERDLQRLGGLTQLLGEADVMMVQHANESAFALSSPQRCATAGAREPTVPRGPARSEVLAIEAEIVRANELGRSGRLSDAVNVAQAAVERAKATGAVATLAATLLAQGHAQRRAGDYRSATETLQQAVASAERAGAVDLVVRAAAELVRALSEQRRLDTAEGVLLMALTRIARGDAGDAEAAELYFQAGVLRMAQQRADESIDALEQGLVLATKVYGPDHPHTAALHNSLGNALKDAGRYDEALEQLEIGLATWTERLGPRHSSVALALNNIGNVRMRQGDPAEALTLYTRARDVGRSAYPPGHPDLAIFYGNLADARSTVGDSAAAIDSYTRAIDILRANDEKEGQTLARTLHARGFLRLELGHAAAATEDLRAAYDLKVQALGALELSTLQSQDALAEALAAAGQLEQARTLHEQALALRTHLQGPDDLVVAISHLTLAATLERQGHGSEALHHREQAVAIRTRAEGEDAMSTVWARLALGHSALQRGRAQQALVLLSAAVPRLDDADLATREGRQALRDLAATQLELDDRDAAVLVAERALGRLATIEGLAPASAAPTWFVAARVLSSTEPQRARELACRATMALGSVPGNDALRHRVQSWLHGARCALDP